MNRRLIFLTLIPLLLGLLTAPAALAQSSEPLVVLMTGDGAVSPAMSEYLTRGIRTAEQAEADKRIAQAKAEERRAMAVARWRTSSDRTSGRMTCSPPQRDSKPAASARRQSSSAASPSIPMLLANASPTFIHPSPVEHDRGKGL